MSNSGISIPPQEPEVGIDGVKSYYGVSRAGNLVPIAKMVGCRLLLPWRLHGNRVTVFVASYDRRIENPPGHIHYYGRHISGTLSRCEMYAATGKPFEVIGFTPSAKHLDRFEEPKYFE